MFTSYHIASLARRIRATSEAWETYRKEHPNTKKTEKEFLEDLENNKKDDTEDDLELELEEEPEKPHNEDLENNDLDPKIDPVDLNKSLDEILGEKSKKKDIGEKLEEVAEKLVDITDFDQYVQNLPEKAKSLAQHLRDQQTKNEESAEKILEERPDIKYDQYVTDMKKRKDPILPKKDWEAIAKKLKDKADKEKAKSEKDKED